MPSSKELLVDHAYQNVWCAPGQDKQHIVGPARMSKPAGEVTSIKVGMRSYYLPKANTRYHAFVIGDLPPVLVGMATIVDAWVSAQSQCNAAGMLIDIYTDKGIRVPLYKCYFLYTRNGDLILLIEDVAKVVKLGVEKIWLRWRSNAYFQYMGSTQIRTAVEIEGIVPTTQAEFALYQARWRASRDKPGYSIAFVNGRRVRDINVATAQLGDYLEFVYDSSVREVVHYSVRDLKTFDSELDSKAKYMLNRPGLSKVVDYVDDIDIYVTHWHLEQAYTGVYYHQNHIDSVRMVTHRDYSIPTAYLLGFVTDQPDWEWMDDVRVEVLVRHGGVARELVNEAHRIKELMKLHEQDRLDVMTGDLAPVSIWTASALENSDYIKLMGTDAGDVTKSLVTEAYGYNAISVIIGDTPAKIEVTGQWVDLPPSLIGQSTIFEYGIDGVLLGWYIHDNSLQYPVRNSGAVYLEGYVGKGGVGLSTVYDKKTVQLEEGVDYRFYISDIWNGQPRNNWRDVTGDEDYYTINNGVFTWDIDLANYHVAVKNSRDFLAYDIELNYRDELLAFSITNTEVRSGNVALTGMMDIPPGQVHLYINNRPAIAGIDYYFDWPACCVVNKKFLVEGPIQKITVVARGFCSKDMKLEYPRDVGFVAYNTLSHNSRFNVRDDKVSRIVIGGAIYTRDEVGFSEDGSVVINEQVGNGWPYEISHPVIPMMGFASRGTDELREEAQEIDQEIEDFLTLYLPEPVRPDPNPIEYWYPVYSPFAAKLIYDMLNGILVMDEFKGEYSLEFVRERLAGYDWIVPFDPVVRGVDERYVIVHPHPEDVALELTVYQYRLLDRAIQVFLDGRVQLNRHLVIIEEGYEHETDDHPHPHRLWSEVE